MLPRTDAEREPDPESEPEPEPEPESAPDTRASPCINVCEMHPQSGLCIGCWRTLDEIAAWSSMSPLQRQGVWRALSDRRGAALTRGPLA